MKIARRLAPCKDGNRTCLLLHVFLLCSTFFLSQCIPSQYLDMLDGYSPYGCFQPCSTQSHENWFICTQWIHGEQNGYVLGVAHQRQLLILYYNKHTFVLVPNPHYYRVWNQYYPFSTNGGAHLYRVHHPKLICTLVPCGVTHRY
jgi:hypothetical protein